MSDIHPGTPRDDVDRPNLTVEDAGTTTDPADLVGEERARQGDEPFTGDSATDADPSAASTSAAVSDSTTTSGTAVSDASATSSAADAQTAYAASADAGSASASASASTSTDDRAEGLAALAGDDSIGHVFDQTNGVIDGLEGDSDGTAESDGLSASERGDENPDLFHEGIVDGGDGGSDDTRRTGN